MRAPLAPARTEPMDRVTTIPPHLFQTSGKLGFRRLASGGRCSSRRPRRREGRSSVSILSSVDHPPSLSLAAIALFHWFALSVKPFGFAGSLLRPSLSSTLSVELSGTALWRLDAMLGGMLLFLQRTGMTATLLMM
uniref:Uncharacterized protein n=1 Tax=Oryza meridionalis TaxID=40149 RepID=A0A0E0FA85_9ORYZ